MTKSKIQNNSKIPMPNIKIKILPFEICVLTLFCHLSFGICHSAIAQDKIIAIVNKDIITQKDLNDFINFTRVQLATQYRGEQLESKIQSMKLDLLGKLIDDRLILQEAKRKNIRINPEKIKSRINEIKKHYGSDSEFESTLAKQGLVQADLELKIREQLLMFVVIENEIKSKIKVNPGEVTDFYQENTAMFILPEQREFETIAVDNEALADEVFDKIKKEQDLQKVANSYSLTVNKFTCARDGQLRKEIEDAIFKINLTRTSAPIRIQDKYYIFKLNNIIPPRQQNLCEVQHEVYTMLFNMKMEADLAKWLDELKKRSYVKILQGGSDE